MYDINFLRVKNTKNAYFYRKISLNKYILTNILSQIFIHAIKMHVCII